jgi:hypothetical protein
VILSVGGLLGLGAKYVSVPFDALRVTEKEGKRYLVIDATKEALTSAPGYQYDRATANIPLMPESICERSGVPWDGPVLHRRSDTQSDSLHAAH